MTDNDLNGSPLPEPCIIVIFGVTGNLARRELMPALYEFTRQRRSMPGAYEWLLHDAMGGDQTLFPRADWDSSRGAARRSDRGKVGAAPRADLPNYEAGSSGPDAAEQLLRRDRRLWHAGPSTTQQA